MGSAGTVNGSVAFSLHPPSSSSSPLSVAPAFSGAGALLRPASGLFLTRANSGSPGRGSYPHCARGATVFLPPFGILPNVTCQDQSGAAIAAVPLSIAPPPVGDRSSASSVSPTSGVPVSVGTTGIFSYLQAPVSVGASVVSAGTPVLSVSATAPFVPVSVGTSVVSTASVVSGALHSAACDNITNNVVFSDSTLVMSTFPGDSNYNSLVGDVFTSQPLVNTQPVPVGSITASFPALSSVNFIVPIVPNRHRALCSLFADLFPDRHLSCYRVILPYVRIVSEQAWVFLDSCLPTHGPIQSRHFALLLSHATFMFDLTDCSVPILVENIINGYRFLHFTPVAFCDIFTTLMRLFAFDGFIGGGSTNIDPVSMMGTAASVGAATIAANDASTAYRETLGALIPLSVMLTEEEMTHLRRERHVSFKQNNNVSNDHSLVAACREIVRHDLKAHVKLETTELRTLVLGATQREYKLYKNNKFIYFQLANREGKDTDRMVIDMLKSYRKVRSRKATSKTKNKTSVTISRAIDDVTDTDNMLRLWRSNRKLPERFLVWEQSQLLLQQGCVAPDVTTDDNFQKYRNERGVFDIIAGIFDNDTKLLVPSTHTFDQIIFEDVGYNFTANDWYKIFKNTGAMVAYGYMCLPWQLVFPDMCPPPGYLYKVEGDMSLLAYPGFSNGYAHKTKAWSTLMRSAVMNVKGLSLGVEIVSRAGPMAFLKIYRCEHRETVTRVLALPPYLRTVLILNIRQSINKYTKSLDENNLRYFPMRLDEFEDALNYALDIARESLQARTIMVYIRRKTVGMSLVTKELSKCWSLDKGLVTEVAEVVYLVALHNIGILEQIEKDLEFYSSNPVTKFVTKKLKRMISPVLWLYNLIRTSNNYMDLLVKNIENQHWQTVVTTGSNKHNKAKVFVGINPEDLLDPDMDIEEEEEEEKVDCSFCEELQECVGTQKFKCTRNRSEGFTHDFALSDSELRKLRTSLGDTTKDPAGLKIVKEEALSKVPAAAFSINIRVRYLCGPPGTGKSYAIRGLATSKDLVLAPFSRLKEDYTDFIHPITGRKTSLKFYTQHTGFSAMNHTRIFCDEYTAMPYECLAIIAFRCAANEIILVGDHRQTSLINEVEGIAIPTKIDMSQVRKHELIKNYRNPSDVVAVLNTLYGYHMEATNTRLGYSFDTTKNLYLYKDYTPLFFRRSTAESFGVDKNTTEKVTVRANQGATYENIALVVTNGDQDLFNMPSFAIVALSRHRNKCVILHEGDEAGVFAGMVKGGLPTGLKNQSRPKKTTKFNDGDEGTTVSKTDRKKKPVQEKVEQSTSPADEQASSHNMTGTSRSSSLLRNFKSFLSNRFGLGTDPDMPELETCLDDEDSSDSEELSGGYKLEPGEVMLEGHPIEAIPSSIPSFNIPMPQENTCLIKTIHELTGWPEVEIWHLFVEILGDGAYMKVESSGLSTADLEKFCTRNNVRCRVYTDDENFLSFGTSGDFMGCLKFTGPVEAGHFEKYNENSDPPRNSDDALNKTSAFVISFPNNGEKKKPSTRLISSPISKTRVPTVESCGAGTVGNLKISTSTAATQGAVHVEQQSGNSVSHFDSANVGQHVQPSNVDNRFAQRAGYQPKWYKRRSSSFLVKYRELPEHVIYRDNIPTMTSKLMVLMSGIRSMFPDFNPGLAGGHYVYFRDFLNDGGHNFTNAIELRAKHYWYRQYLRACNGETNPIYKPHWSDDEHWDDSDSGGDDMGGPGSSRSRSFRFPKVSKTTKTNKKSTNDNISGNNEDKGPSTSESKDQKSDPQTTQKSGALSNPGTFTRHFQFMQGGGDANVRPVTQLSVARLKVIDYEPLASASESFLIMARLFTDPVKVTEYLEEVKILPRDPYVSLEQSSYDAYKLLVEDFATVSEGDLMLTNQESLGYLEPNFGSGLFDLSRLDNLNPRGHPKRTKEKAYSLLAVAPGVTYFKNNLVQSLACLQARYLTKAMMARFNNASIAKANEIADLFFNEHMSLNLDILNEQDLWTTTIESERSMKQKNYEAQVKFESGGDTDVRFSMKDIFKPFKTKVDVFKVGQGISAWSRDTQVIFQTAFRVINKVFINSLKNHVVYDNGIDEVTLMNRINALFYVLPSVCLNGVIDATACDSGQNRFTQRIERRILERLGLAEYFLDWYYQFREEYILKGYGVTAKVRDIKTSGEPATLLNNTILMAALMNYLIRGEGPCVIVIKGDDGLKRQANLRYDLQARGTLRDYLKMEFKVDIDVPITFCGYFLYKATLVPDLIRKVFKILGHRFRDFEHFKEYQESLRDWILNCNKLGINDICAVTAEAYGLEYEYCYALFHSVVSLSHISREQFLATFILREYDWGQDLHVSDKWSLKTPWYHGYN